MVSKLQAIVTVSSMEAEYVARFFTVQVVVWIRQLLRDISQHRFKPTRVFIDNSFAHLFAFRAVQIASQHLIDTPMS